MNWVTYQELVEDTETLSRELSDSLVGVVGIPRSGMLAASLVALHRGVHLSDLDGFIRSGGAFYRPGDRMNWIPPEGGTVVVIDDSSYGGATIERAKRCIRASALQSYYKIVYATVYYTEQSRYSVDFVGREISTPRLFQWNLWTHPQLLNTICDLDGVICREPPSENDEDTYSDSLPNLPVLYRPQQKVAEIVTGRLEKYREITQYWLDKNGIPYGKLTMCPAFTKETRRSQGAWSYKANFYKRSQATLFIESELADAQCIAQQTAKPVLCIKNWMMYSSGATV